MVGTELLITEARLLLLLTGITSPGRGRARRIISVPVRDMEQSNTQCPLTLATWVIPN